MHHTLKMYGKVEVQLHMFLTLALDGGEWSASCPCFFIPGKESWYPTDRRLGGPQRWFGHDGKEEKSLPCPYLESNPDHLTCSLVTILTELPWLH
jgi:hypothetical protein